MAKKDQATIKEVDSAPEVRMEKEEMVMIHIDNDLTRGGIRVNGKLYVGNVKVTVSQAKDLQRIQEEFIETDKKLTNPGIHVRMKSDFQKEVLFLANPQENEKKNSFTRDYGLLGLREWQYCSDEFKAQLLEKRKQLYGY